jgi:mRNA interferase MazF
MATMPTRADVWLVDLGMVAKVRPCLVLSIPADEDNDRVLTTIVPHTTSTRDSRFEVRSNVRFLKPGAFDAQNIVTIPTVKLIRRLGALTVDQTTQVEEAVKLWLGLKTA